MNKSDDKIGADADNRRLRIGGGELVDYPGWWKITARFEDETEAWTFIRKEDGTYWEIRSVDYFPRTGEMVRIALGDQITDSKLVDECDSLYADLQDAAAKRSCQRL